MPDTIPDLYAAIGLLFMLTGSAIGPRAMACYIAGISFFLAAVCSGFTPSM